MYEQDQDNQTYELIPAPTPEYRNRPKKRRNVLIPALLLLSFGFGSGYAVGEGATYLTSRLSTTTVATTDATTNDVARDNTEDIAQQTTYVATASNKTITVPELAIKAAD